MTQKRKRPRPLHPSGEFVTKRECLALIENVLLRVCDQRYAKSETQVALEARLQSPQNAPDAPETHERG